jgi:hypothetical protein
MSNVFSESEDSFEIVDGIDSVVSLDSWNNSGDDGASTLGSNEEQNGALADQFNFLDLDEDDESSSLVSLAQVLQETLRTTEPENLPTQQSDAPGSTPQFDAANDLAGRSSSRVENLRDRLGPSETVVYCSEPPRYETSGPSETVVYCREPPRYEASGPPASSSIPGPDTRPHTDQDEETQDDRMPDVMQPPLPSSPITRAWGTNAEVFSAPEHLMFRGTFEQAMAVAKDQKKLLLVNLQDDEGPNAFGSFAVNRDIFGLEQFQNIVPDRYIFIQLSAGNREAADYARHFQVEHFPHLGILHPEHRSILWGVDGWSSEQPWAPEIIMEALADWGFGRFTHEHHERMEVEAGEEKFVIRPITDINQEYLLQEVAMADIDLDDPQEIADFFHLQSAMLLS